MPMKYLTIAIFSFVFLLACDDSPTGPGDDLVGDKLVTVFDAVGGEVRTASEEYTLRGNRLTLVDDIDGSVEIWERRK